jgi:endonuclease YncB( thermonuclease family)
MDATDRKKRLRAKIYITIFFLVLAGLCLGFTVGIAPTLKGVQANAASKIPHWTCEEVLSGDTVRIKSLTTSQVVRIRGIVAPPREEGPALAEMARTLDFPEQDLLHQGEMARNALSVWIYKRRLDVEWLEDARETGPDVATGYISVFGVDVGRKMLQGGQAMAVREDHPRREAYAGYEEEARARERGIWRSL